MDIAELKAGLTFEPVACEVEKGMVRRFAEAIGDPSSSSRGFAPPALLLTIGLDRIQARLLDLFPGTTILHGSTELECYHPVRAGDLIDATAKITGIRERQSERGKIAFITVDITFENQHKELVAKCRQLIIQH